MMRCFFRKLLLNIFCRFFIFDALIISHQFRYIISLFVEVAIKVIVLLLDVRIIWVLRLHYWVSALRVCLVVC